MLLTVWPDVWIFPVPPSSPEYLLWTRAGNLAGLACFPALVLFHAHAFHRPGRILFRVFLGLDALAALLFTLELLGSAEIFFRMGSGGMTVTPWYGLVMGPCATLFLVLIIGILAGWRRKVKGRERSRSNLLLAAWCGLALGGTADWATLAASWTWPGQSFTVWGVAGFAGAAVAILVSRLLEVHRENLGTMDRLASAYALLRQDAGLRDLGASTAMISHEIRNYVAALKGNAALLGGPESSPGVEAIREAAERLETISRGISDLGSSAVPAGSGTGVRLAEVAGRCVERHFRGREGTFRVTDATGGAVVRADPDRLEQALLNLFRNALEAGAGSVEVRLRAWGGRLIAAVEDDGHGCADSVLVRIGTPFFTGRDGRGGTGLGCSISAGILRAHGASLRVYAKNALGGGERGLVAIAVFPLPGRDGPANREAVVLGDAEAVRSSVLPPLLNLGVRPILLQGADSLPRFAGQGRPLLLAGGVLAEAVLPAWKEGPAFFADHHRVMWSARTGGSPSRTLLSEERLAEPIPEPEEP